MHTQHHEVVGVLLNHPGEQSEGVRLTRLSRTRDGSVRKECDRSDTLRGGALAPRPTGHFWAVLWARVPLFRAICGQRDGFHRVLWNFLGVMVCRSREAVYFVIEFLYIFILSLSDC